MNRDGSFAQKILKIGTPDLIVGGLLFCIVFCGFCGHADQTTDEQTYNTFIIDYESLCSHVIIESINLILEENELIKSQRMGGNLEGFLPPTFCRRSRTVWGFFPGKS